MNDASTFINESAGNSELALDLAVAGAPVSGGEQSLILSSVINFADAPLATPAVSTAASVTGGGVVGTAVLSDTADLTGGDSPTGTINFSLTAPDGSTTQEGSVAVNGDGSYASPVAVTAEEVGTYTWHAQYSGDANNSTASDDGANEGVITVQASPAITTSPGGTVVLGSGAGLSDTAVLSGGYDLTGSITFTLYAPNGSTVVTTETVPVSGAGSYSTPTPYVPNGTGTLTGTYEWGAAYSGDLNNDSVSSPPRPSRSRSARPARRSRRRPAARGPGHGAGLSDTAVLSGGYDLTGTITFTLYAPNGATVVTPRRWPVDRQRSYTHADGRTCPRTGTLTGTYQWDASY